MNEVSTAGINSYTPVSAGKASSAPASQKAEQGGKTLPSEPVQQTSDKEVSKPDTSFLANVEQAVAHMNEYIQATQRDLLFSYDADSGDTIVKVVDSATQKVIRQIPDEIFLKLARELNADEPVPLLQAPA